MPWLETLRFPTVVNLRDTCNAVYTGSGVNFYRSGNGCNNTGMIADVVYHEWGHGLDDHTRPGDASTGEGTADVVSMMMTHSPLMAPAAEVMEQALSKVEMAAPAVPVVANVTAQAASDPDTIRRRLVEQVTAPVRWRECVLYMRDNGVESLFELGAGKVLTTLARRIDRELAASAAGGPDEIEAMLKSF